MDSRSNSSLQIGIPRKLREYLSFFRMRMHGMLHPDDFEWVFDNLYEYDQYLNKYSDMELGAARILEIGFGARPNRLIALSSMGIAVRGVDLDRPILSGSWSEFRECYRKNGVERLIKSFVRHWLFDRHDRRALKRALARHGYRLVIDDSKFMVSDVAACEFGSGSFDLIYSEDVFEHIPKKSLDVVVERMARWLAPQGIAIVRPCIYTGITGGHLAEWFPHAVADQKMKRRSEPWEHLRKRRYPGNVFLNEMMRREYRELFSKNFQIIHEAAMNPSLGKEWLTDEVRKDLERFPDEELFSNNVIFVLRSLKN